MAAKGKTGIFLDTENVNISDVIMAAMGWVQNANIDSGIEMVKKDVEYAGYRLYFSNEAPVPELLKARSITIKGQEVSIHPLTTNLVVHNAFPSSSADFTTDLQARMDQLGKVLSVSKIPISPEFPDIGNGNWNIVMDIPEIENWHTFKSNGLPENMKVKVGDDEYQVTFSCCLCQEAGHTSQNCNTILKEPSNDKNNCDFNVPHVKIKQEVIDDHPPPSKRPSENSGPSSRPPGKKFKGVGKSKSRDEFSSASLDPSLNPYVLLQPLNSSEEILGLASSFPSSSADTTDPLEHLETVIIKTEPLETLVYDADVLETRSDTSDKSSTSGTSSSMPTQSKKYKPRKPAVIQPVYIPQRIRDIIDSYDDVILSADMLEAFFNHVKKKACPAKVAAQYTDHVDRLKRQLMWVKQTYYITPVAGTVEEKLFMKWFESIVMRFDAPPSKRGGARF